jgi:nucleotidyltransferase-like protein
MGCGKITTRADFDHFMADFVATFPEVTEIWLLGSRANEKADPDSDWDLLVFSADRLTAGHLTAAPRFHDECFQLFIVTGTYFRWPWPREKDGCLCDGWLDRWRWTAVPGRDGQATYSGNHGPERASRIWPPAG